MAAYDNNETGYDEGQHFHGHNDYNNDDELDTLNDTLGTTKTGIATFTGTEIVTSNTRSTDDGEYANGGSGDGDFDYYDDDNTDVSRITLPIDPPARGDGRRIGFGNNYQYDSRRRLGNVGLGVESPTAAMVANDIEDANGNDYRRHHRNHHDHHSDRKKKKNTSNKSKKNKKATKSKNKSDDEENKNESYVIDGFDIYTWWGFVAFVVIMCVFIYLFVSNY